MDREALLIRLAILRVRAGLPVAGLRNIDRALDAVSHGATFRLDGVGSVLIYPDATPSSGIRVSARELSQLARIRHP